MLVYLLENVFTDEKIKKNHIEKNLLTLISTKNHLKSTVFVSELDYCTPLSRNNCTFDSVRIRFSVPNCGHAMANVAIFNFKWP